MRDHDVSWGIKCSILQPWVVVGTHGHQRVGCRSTDCWDPETDDGAMHCNEAAVARHSLALHGAGDWRLRQDAAVWCPLSPHCPCSPPTPPAHTGEIACLSRPRLHISLTLPRNSTPILPQEKLEAWLAVALNIHNTNPATFPSSQSRGGG